MTRKVILSKSVSSEEHFQYLSYGHIFPRSKDIYNYVKFFTLLVSYVWVHHVFLTITHSWDSNFLNQKYQKILMSSNRQKNLMGCLK